jgi:hypothetical protein
MPRIKIEVKENIATNLTPEIEIVSNNGDYEIEFSFDSLWDSSSVKTARFYYNFSHTDIVFEGNVCKVPPLYETQLLKVGVFTDTNKTTTDAEIKCRFSIKKYGGNVHEPPKDVYAQIIDLLNKYIEQGGSGGISREEVERIIGEYLTENPPKDGVDGFSPTITTTAIENGTRVSITDINGTKSFDVLNGKDGTEISIASKIEEQTLTIELKDKDGNVIASSEVTLPTQEIPEIDLSNYQTKTDNTLDTESKEVVGAINELNSGKVGVNDFATSKKAGLIKANEGGGIKIQSGDGVSYIVPASESEIISRVQKFKPIVPQTLDLSVKDAVVNNSLTLTEEEKASACDWLGALKKVDSVTTWTQVYGKGTDGNQQMFNVHGMANAYTIPQRQQNGVLYVGTPTEAKHATTKKYVDDLITALQAQIDELKGV